MYAKVDSDDGRKRSIAAMHWLVHDFPKSWFGKTGKKELALVTVGQPLRTAAASPSPEVIAAPATLPSAVPASDTSAATVPPEHASGGVAARPVPNP